MCDARTIEPGALIPSDLVYRNKVGETYSFAASPAHRWLYYPALQTDEVLLLKIFDWNTDGTTDVLREFLLPLDASARMTVLQTRTPRR